MVTEGLSSLTEKGQKAPVAQIEKGSDPDERQWNASKEGNSTKKKIDDTLKLQITVLVKNS